MLEKPIPTKKLSDKNTKQEMLDAYQTLVKQLEEKRAAELNPEKKIEERKTEAAVKVAETLAPEGVGQGIGNLKGEIGKMLADISDKLEEEVRKYRAIQTAIEARERELQELYGIEKAAATLAALIESQNQKRRDFEAEMAREKEELTGNMETTRAEWDKERKVHELEIKERDTAERKAREREKEEFFYAFNREQQTAKDKLNDEKARLEKELQQKKETAEKELTQREKALAEKEAELADLRAKVLAAPKQLEAAVDKAVKEVGEKLKLESKNREELLKKEYDGDRNVLTTQIQSLEKVTKEQAERINKLSQQLEAAYQKVQAIAEKAIEGSSNSKAFADLQKLLADHGRKAAPDK